MITRRALLLFLAAAPILALASLTSAAFLLAAIYLVGVLALLVLDFWLSPKPRDFRLARDNESKLSLGADNLIKITIRRMVTGTAPGLSSRPVEFILRDEPPQDFIISELFQTGVVAPGETVTVTPGSIVTLPVTSTTSIQVVSLVMWPLTPPPPPEPDPDPDPEPEPEPEP